MDLWNDATTELFAFEEKHGRTQKTLDQQLKLIEIKALLAIGQELSAINPQNTSSRAADGSVRNGWGIKTGDTNA